MPIIKNCLTCGKKIKTRASRIKDGRGKFCSQKCKRVSPEIREKIRNSLTGRTPSMETRKKLSESRRGIKHPRWKGGKTTTVSGYVTILKPNHPSVHSKNYVLEHRLVIEKEIGRYLKRTEHAHHLGKKDDNRPHMLMAFSSNSAHIRFHKNPNNVKQEEIIFDGRDLSLQENYK